MLPNRGIAFHSPNPDNLLLQIWTRMCICQGTKSPRELHLAAFFSDPFILLSIQSVSLKENPLSIWCNLLHIAEATEFQLALPVSSQIISSRATNHLFDQLVLECYPDNCLLRGNSDSPLVISFSCSPCSQQSSHLNLGPQSTDLFHSPSLTFPNTRDGKHYDFCW